MKLSIVICLYNTDRELFRSAVKSIVDGTLSSLDYEICIVDDGSRVDYSDIIREYNLRYERGENRGILAARLRGIEMARGEYIAFMDSDDTVSANYHLPMVFEAEATGADIVLNDWAFHTDRVRYFCKNDTTVSTDFVYEGADVLRAFMSKEGREHSYFVLWNKVFRREVLFYAMSEILKRLDSTLYYNYSEDALISFFAFSAAKKVANAHTGYYYYRIHDSQSVKVVSRERLLSHARCMAKTLAVFREALCELSRSELLPRLESWAALMSRTHYSYAHSGGYTDLYAELRTLYGVDALSKSTLADGAVYRSISLIGENIPEIDAQLLRVFNSKTVPSVSYSQKDSYVVQNLAFFERMGRSHTVAEPYDVIIPRQRVRFRNKLLRNKFFSFVAMLLFPKGSKIRGFLKAKL